LSKLRLLIFIVIVGVILYVLLFLSGIDSAYSIRYPMLTAVVILFVVTVAMLTVFRGRRVIVRTS
jgi:hypothetical protein